MTLKTVPVTGILYNPDGSVSVGTAVVATLTVMDTDGGVVVPTQVSATTDSTGSFTLNLWPNSRGVNGSQYRVRANVPGALPGVLLLNVLITVPDSDPATPVPIASITNRVGPAVLSDAVAAMLAAQGSALQAASSLASVAYLYPGVYTTPPTTRPDGSAIQPGDRYNGSDGYGYAFRGGVWVSDAKMAAQVAASVAFLYPGQYPTAPTLRPDGTAIQNGDRYNNSTDGYEYIRINGVWTSAADSAQSAAASAASASSAAAAAVPTATHGATSKPTPADADELPLTDSAASFGLKKLTWANLRATMFSAWGAMVAAATTKATPVDADTMTIADSAASNATKQLTWANMKATLKAYFDAFYFGVSATSTKVNCLTAVGGYQSAGAGLYGYYAAGTGAAVASLSGAGQLQTDPLLLIGSSVKFLTGAAGGGGTTNATLDASGNLTVTASVIVPRVKVGAYTVATLPSASTAGGGAMSYATDLASLTNGSIAVGGGALKGILKSDGTNWIVLG